MNTIINSCVHGIPTIRVFSSRKRHVVLVALSSALNRPRESNAHLSLDIWLWNKFRMAIINNIMIYFRVVRAGRRETP